MTSYSKTYYPFTRRFPSVLASMFCYVLLVGCDRTIDKVDCTSKFLNGDYGRFQVNTEAGTAFDPRTKITWYRCAAGQTYSGVNCRGNPLKLIKKKTASYIEDFSEKTGRIWRIPKKKDMQEIMETTCDSPAVNPNVFPDLPVNNFWTSDSSWHGSKFGCSFSSYQGNVFCRQHVLSEQHFMLISGGDKDTSLLSSLKKLFR